MDYVRKFLQIDGIIGQGAFGQVLVTSPLQNQQQIQLNHSPNNQITANNYTNKFALKCVHPLLKPQRLANELRHLRDLGGQCNVVQMHTAHFHKGSLYIVMELIEHDKFIDIVPKLDHNEIVMYIKNLLIALEHVHAHDIMHRDVKPANFLFNRRDKKFLLVDFGLAQKLPMARSAPTPKHTNQSISQMTTPTTPTSTGSRRITGPLFPVLSHMINLTPIDSTGTPNLSTKRLLPEGLNPNEHFNHDFKKLRVSNIDKLTNDESKERVQLTVGAYESPVTTNDISTSRRNIQISRNPHQFSTPTVPSRRLTPGKRCGCRGKPKTCSICMSRPESFAPKSGTPGYKAPEILLRCPNQNSAIDIWSAGVILACLLSGHTPFFRDVDDHTALAEIMTILGSQRVGQAARALGVRLNVEPKRNPVDLMQFCKTIRMAGKDKRQLDIPDEAFDLLNRMLDPNPHTRITASDALKHSWLSDLN